MLSDRQRAILLAEQRGIPLSEAILELERTRRDQEAHGNDVAAIARARNQRGERPEADRRDVEAEERRRRAQEIADQNAAYLEGRNQRDRAASQALAERSEEIINPERDELAPRYRIPGSPTRAELRQRGEEALGINPIATSNAPYDFERRAGFTPPLQPDTFGDVGRKWLENLPARGRRILGGLMEAMPEVADQFQPGSGVLRDAFIDEMVRQGMSREEATRRMDRPGAAWWREHGRAMFERGTHQLEINRPVGNDAVQFGYDLANGLVDFAAAISVTAATKSPTLGAAVVGVEVFGDQYGESISQGRSPRQAFADASIYSLAEMVGERVAIGHILRPGLNPIRRAGVGAVAEGIQEASTETLQTAYDAGIIGEDMTLGEAISRIRYAGMIGSASGGIIGSVSGRASSRLHVRHSDTEVNRSVIESYDPNQDVTSRLSRGDIESPIPDEVLAAGREMAELPAAEPAPRRRGRPRREPSPLDNADAREVMRRRIRTVESSGNVNAQNPRSSASGLYQFTNDTFLRMHRRVYGGNMSDAQRLRYKNNPTTQERLMDALLDENEGALRRNHRQVTPGNLYLSHFLGSGGAEVVLSQPDRPVEQLLPASVINANPFLRGMSGQDVVNWAASRMSGTRFARGQGGDVPRETAREDYNFDLSTPDLMADLRGQLGSDFGRAAQETPTLERVEVQRGEERRPASVEERFDFEGEPMARVRFGDTDAVEEVPQSSILPLQQPEAPAGGLQGSLGSQSLAEALRPSTAPQGGARGTVLLGPETMGNMVVKSDDETLFDEIERETGQRGLRKADGSRVYIRTLDEESQRRIREIVEGQPEQEAEPIISAEQFSEVERLANEFATGGEQAPELQLSQRARSPEELAAAGFSQEEGSAAYALQSPEDAQRWIGEVEQPIVRQHRQAIVEVLRPDLIGSTQQQADARLREIIGEPNEELTNERAARFGEIDERLFDLETDGSKSATRAFAKRLVREGVLEEGEYAEIDRILKDRDMGVEDATSEIRTSAQMWSEALPTTPLPEGAQKQVYQFPKAPLYRGGPPPAVRFIDGTIVRRDDDGTYYAETGKGGVFHYDVGTRKGYADANAVPRIEIGSWENVLKGENMEVLDDQDRVVGQIGNINNWDQIRHERGINVSPRFAGHVSMPPGAQARVATPQSTELPGTFVATEVAPNPEDPRLSSLWNSAPFEKQDAITRNVVDTVLPGLFTSLGVNAKYTVSVGGYGGASNPNVMIEVDSPERAREVASAVGAVLGQQEVGIQSDRPFPGSIIAGAVQIKMPEGASPAEVFKRLQGVEGLPGGFSLTDDGMVLFDYGNEDVTQLADRIDAVLGDDYVIEARKAHAGLIGEDEYAQPQQGRPDDQPRREALDRARREAARLRWEGLEDAGVTGNLPDRGGPDVREEAGRLRRPPVEPDGTVRLFHKSKRAGLTTTDPSQWANGEGLANRDERNYRNFAPGRTYFGMALGQRGGYTGEFGLGAHTYEGRVPADQLYDFAADPDGFYAEARRRIDQQLGKEMGAIRWNIPANRISRVEKLIKDAGYKGYWVQDRRGMMAAVFDPVDVKPVSAKPSDAQASLNSFQKMLESPENYGSEKEHLDALRAEIAEYQKRFEQIAKGLNLPAEVHATHVITDPRTGQPVTDVLGFHQKGLIVVGLAYNEDPFGVLDHEAVHSLREAGLLSKTEWNLLVSRAKANKELWADINDRYEDEPEFMKEEEAVADMFSEWRSENADVIGPDGKPVEKPKTTFDRIMTKLLQIIDTLGRAVGSRSSQLREAVRVMEKMSRGEVGARQPFADMKEQRDLLMEDRARAFIDRSSGQFAISRSSRHAFPDANIEANYLTDRQSGPPRPSNMKPSDYDLFSRKVLLDDLDWKAASGETLPYGFTPDAVKAAKSKIDQRVSSNEAVRNAVRRHKLAELLAERAGSVTPEAVTDTPVSTKEPPKAGNIRLDLLDGADQIKSALTDASDRMGKFKDARRGVVSHAEMRAFANEIGIPVKKLLQRNLGEAWNAESLLSARQLLVASADDLVAKAEAAKGGDDAAIVAFRKAWIRHVAIQEQVAGLTAEAGRALNQFRLMAQTGGDATARMLKEVIDVEGGRQDIENVARIIVENAGDPAKLNRFARDLYTPNWRDKLFELWINGLLSGPQTHLVNATSNTITALASVPEHGLAAVVGKVRSAVTGNQDRIIGSEVGARAVGLITGARDGLLAFSKTIVTGEGSDVISKLEARHQQAIKGTKGAVIRVPSRLLLAADEFYKGVASRQELVGQAIRIAHKEGLTGQEARDRVDDLVANPPDDLLDRVVDYARYQTFTNTLGEKGQSFMAWANKWHMRPIVPFIRTPTNIFKYAIARTPAAPLLKEVRDDFRAGGSRADLATARVMMGTGIAALVVSLAASGLITGGEPPDDTTRRMLRATGWQPYSFKIGDRYISYARLDPFATIIGLAADYTSYHDHMSDEERSEASVNMVTLFLNQIKNKTFLQGLGNAIEAIEDPNRYGTALVARFAGTAVPTGVAHATSAIDPTLRDTRVNRDEIEEAHGHGLTATLATVVRASLNQIKSRIPGLSDNLPVRRDVWGRPIVREGSLGPDYLSPFWVSTDQHDEITQQLLAAGAKVGPPSRRVQGRELSAADYDAYQETAGRYAREDAEAFVGSDDWEAMTNEERADEWKRMLDGARRDARADLALSDN